MTPGVPPPGSVDSAPPTPLYVTGSRSWHSTSLSRDAGASTSGDRHPQISELCSFVLSSSLFFHPDTMDFHACHSTNYLCFFCRNALEEKSASGGVVCKPKPKPERRKQPNRRCLCRHCPWDDWEESGSTKHTGNPKQGERNPPGQEHRLTRAQCPQKLDGNRWSSWRWDPRHGETFTCWNRWHLCLHISLQVAGLLALPSSFLLFCVYTCLHGTLLID
jgi:hypothetical protein